MYAMTLERDSIEDNCRACWDHLSRCSFLLIILGTLFTPSIIFHHDTITKQSMAVSLLMMACRNMLENV